MASISCESRLLISFENVSMDTRILSCLGTVFSLLKSLISFSLEEFLLECESDSTPLLLIEPLIVFANSLFMGFTFSFPSKTSIFSKSDIISICLNLLAFAFCLLVDGIKIMRESNIETFLGIGLLRNIQLYTQVNRYDCVIVKVITENCQKFDKVPDKIHEMSVKKPLCSFFTRFFSCYLSVIIKFENVLWKPVIDEIRVPNLFH